MFAVGPGRAVLVGPRLGLAQLFVASCQPGLDTFEFGGDRLAPGVVDVLFFSLAQATAGVLVEGVVIVEVL